MKSTEQNEIVSYELLKINRGRKKICECQSPRYEIDPVNRIVMCKCCGAIVDPYDALLYTAEQSEKWMEYQERALERARYYREEANKNRSRSIKNNVFREMHQQYMKGLFPVCPHCNKAIEPTEIQKWTKKV